jgi:hypothetical protein
MPEVRLGRLRRGDRVCSLVRPVIVATALCMPAQQVHLRLQSVPLTCLIASPSFRLVLSGFSSVCSRHPFPQPFQFPSVPSHPSGSHG